MYYRQYYAAESRHSAHGSPASTRRHVHVDARGVPDRLLVDPAPSPIDGAALGIATSLTALLADYLCEETRQQLVTTTVVGLSALKAGESLPTLTPRS
jgi:hypothetical protein